MPAAPLNYLTFAFSDDGDDHASCDAMASVRPTDVAAAQAEIQTVLAWAQRNKPGRRGPEEDGGRWDAFEQRQDEPDGWVSLTLTLTGPTAWCERLMAHFAPDA